MSDRYLRKWKITAKTDSESWELSTSEDPSALRCVFETDEYLSHTVFGSVTIFNLSKDTIEAIIGAASKSNMKIIIEAGYEDNVGVIWSNEVYQLIRSRDNVVDWTLTFESVNSRLGLHFNFVNWSLADGSDSLKHIEAICQKATREIQIEKTSDTISKNSSSRGSVLFGTALDLLREHCTPYGLVPTFTSDKLTIHQPETESEPYDGKLSLSPSSGLIGTPSQIQYGVYCRALIDPKLRYEGKGKQVKITGALIRMTPIQPDANSQLQSPLEKSGVYKIIRSKFVGDTRGEDWYVDLECCNLSGKNPYAMMGGL